MKRNADIVFIGLSLSSSWGNGHATTFRSLLGGLNRLGQRVSFLERDVSWYAANRDLPSPDFCELHYYSSVADLGEKHAARLRAADAIVVGSFVPDGIAVIDMVKLFATGQLCFYDIDTPVTLARLSSDSCEYLARRQVPLFDVYFSFTGGPTLARLQTEFGAERAEPLYCSVDPGLYAPTGEPVRWDLGYLGTYSPDRQPSLQKLLIDVAGLLPERRFVVAGPQYPDDVAWPHNVARIVHLPPAQHAAFYSRQRYTLNLTRSDMIAAGWSPSVRLFEAAACGTPVISDRWPGLEDFFPLGEAILAAGGAEEMCSLLTATSEAEREAIAAEANRIVSRSHTGLARARDFIAGLTKREAASHAA
jgi:spore maturation protein CgeB